MSEPGYIESSSFDAALRLIKQQEQHIAELERDLLDARRERDEARTRLTFIHALDNLEPEGLEELRLFFIARAAKGGGDEPVSS